MLTVTYTGSLGCSSTTITPTTSTPSPQTAPSVVSSGSTFQGGLLVFGQVTLLGSSSVSGGPTTIGDNATLIVVAAGSPQPALVSDGTVRLGGTLQISLAEKPASPVTVTVLQAASFSDAFLSIQANSSTLEACERLVASRAPASPANLFQVQVSLDSCRCGLPVWALAVIIAASVLLAVAVVVSIAVYSRKRNHALAMQRMQELNKNQYT